MEEQSLKNTPTWAVSIVCFFLILLSLLIEGALHLLTKFLKQRKRKSLNRALRKIKTELMQMGFISLLLTIGEEPISRICVSKSVGNSFLPCSDYELSSETTVASATEVSGLNSTVADRTVDFSSSCETKGMVPLISREGIMQLHIFIFVLAAFHVLYCVMVMCLGIAKMRRWRAWEEDTRTLDYQISHDPRRFRLTRQTSFGRRHLKCWSNHPLMLWPVCFLRQFSGSVTKADYFTLRNGFIMAHFTEGSNFDFRKFLNRAFDEDFEAVVGISFWIWIFSIFFIFFSAHGFYNYFWLPFIPLMMVLVVGTKLQVIITKMCLESRKETVVVRGTLLVKPNDNLFWFGRPQLLFHLIHFILFQNSFQLAFFIWTWYEFGLSSCFHRETEDIVLRISMGVVVQLLCGYVTLPVYALVTQMGSGMKKAVFTERVSKGLKHWQTLASRNLSRNRSSVMGHSSEHSIIDTVESVSEVQELGILECDTFPVTATNDLSPPKTSEEAVQPKAITKETYDGEISFGTSWKEVEHQRSIGAVVITPNLNGTVSDDTDPTESSFRCLKSGR